MPSQVILEQQTDSPANREVPVDRERLRYVTRLLGSQPGLNTALIGTFVFFLSAEKVLNGWWSLLAWVAALVGLRIYFVADQRWMPKYYQQRFGSVRAAREPWSKWDALLGLAFLVLLVIGWPIAHYFNPIASRLLGNLHTMISDPAGQIDLSPSLLWIAAFYGSLRFRMRQRLYFVVVAMIGFASFVFYAVWYPEAKELGLWKILNAGGLGLSLIALGLYDYLSLVLLLPKRVEEGDDE